MSKRASTELNLNFLNNYTLEDEVYLRIDKLQAMCAAQVMLNTSDTPMASHIRIYHSMVIEEQAIELRKLIDQLFT